MRIGPALLAAVVSAHAGTLVQAEETNPATELEAPTVEVVGTTPLPGIGIPVDQVPANVQAITGATMKNEQANTLPEYLERNLGSVSFTDGQANPFQPDLNFRGFTGSPLLGTPQGISAFMDGVRINEAFGDTINWDLIPQSAISTVTLMPGSNPVFGLNTLGGAVSVNTKSGREYPGASVEGSWGSWNRQNAQAEFGGSKGPWDFYVTGNYLDENGWRDHSESQLQQLFGKIGYQTSDFDADLSYSYADNTLNGTQASPLSLLAAGRQLAYTYPDTTTNRLNFINLRLSKVLTRDQILAGNVYYRKLQVGNFNSNTSDDFTGGACPPDCPAANVQSATDQATYGATVQFSLLRALAGFENKLTIGTSYDHGDTRFTQAQQNAVFTSDRNTIGVDDFVVNTDVKGTNTYTGLFATDTFSFNEITHLTLSGRYNRASVSVRDQTGTTPDLNGDNLFVRFNPAAGLNYNPSKALNTYVTYNEGMRAPTPMELTCANPLAPCTLPNAFLSDPPLKPVISKTFELGTRGMLAAKTSYNASLFRTDLRDDIQFITASASNTAGYFQNVGKTRRQGLELGLQQGFDKLSVRAAYSYIDATYQTSFTENSPNNSSANASGDIQVNSGDRIPGIPRHNFKLRADYAFKPTLSAGVNLVYASSQFARGDENNKDANGAVPGYTVVNLDGRWNVTDQLQFFAKVTNLFNRNYETFGILGENFFRGPGFTYDAATAGPEQFRSPGAPRGIWVGVRYEFDKKGAARPATDEN